MTGELTWLRKFSARFQRHGALRSSVFCTIVKTKCVVQSSLCCDSAATETLLICGLRASRYSCWLWDAWHTLTVKTDCEEVVVCSERNKTEQFSSLQSHFILCSLLAAIFLFMLNRWYCGGPTCYTSEKQKNTHAQTYFVRWRHWQYVHKILASQVHTRARTHTPISKIKEK